MKQSQMRPVIRPRKGGEPMRPKSPKPEPPRAVEEASDLVIRELEPRALFQAPADSTQIPPGCAEMPCVEPAGSGT